MAATQAAQEQCAIGMQLMKYVKIILQMAEPGDCQITEK